MRVIDRTFRFIACAMFAALVMAGVGMGAANAQQTTPAQLLQQNPNGGQPLINAVENLVLSDNSTFQAFLGLLGNANDPQKGAIGEGLAQAAKILVLTNQPLAQSWQQQIAAINDRTFQTAWRLASGDVQLGAIGGAPGGAPGAGLGGPGGGPGGGAPEGIHSNPIGTSFFTIQGGTTGAGGTSTTTTTTTITNPVSFSGLNGFELR